MAICNGIAERVKQEAEYIIKNNATIRQAAKRFKVSKTTVHFDVTERLRKIDSTAYKKVRKVLDKNSAESAIRGGIATKVKYQNKK